LYLEWAPIGVFVRPADRKQLSMLKQDAKNLTEQNEKEQGKKSPEQDEPNSKIMAQREDFEPVDVCAVPELDTTLFVKNLNFRTQEESLKKVPKCGRSALM